VNFIPIPQKAEFFVAPNPTARVSLPDVTLIIVTFHLK